MKEYYKELAEKLKALSSDELLELNIELNGQLIIAIVPQIKTEDAGDPSCPPGWAWNGSACVPNP